MSQIHIKAKNVRLFLSLAWRMFHANYTWGFYHWYVKHIAKDTIAQSLKLNDGEIPLRIFKKIQWYMVEAVIMGKMLAGLTGTKLSRNDRTGLIFIGSVMALFDAIIDDFKLEKSKVGQILDNTFSGTRNYQYESQTSIEKVYFLFLDKLIETIGPDKWSEISGHLEKIISQADSAEQLSKTISEANVIRLTLEKGGVSSLICSVPIQDKNEDFLSAVFQTGGFVQMMNDCQDLYKDTKAGIKTFVHFCETFAGIFARLNRERIRTFTLIRSLNYPFYRGYKILFDLNAMFILISYKLHRYAQASSYSLDFESIEKMDSDLFRINPFSPRAIWKCLWRILCFDPYHYEVVKAFKFSR